MSNLRLYIQQNTQVAVVFLLGLLFVLGGIFWSTTLISIGASMIAASIVTYLSPANQEVFQRFLRLGISDVYLSRNRIPPEQWVEWLKSARRHCTLFGISNNNWCRDGDFKAALSNLLRREVEVKVFFLDPTCKVAQQRAKEESPEAARDTVQAIKESVRFIWNLRNEMEENERKFLKPYVYNATPSFGATWVDTLMVATHYLAGFPNLTSPALVIKPVQTAGDTHDLYGIYEQNMLNVERHHATEIKEENVDEYTPTNSTTGAEV